MKKEKVSQKPARGAATFPIVGIGASAGGLAAFEAFFSGMPEETDSGMAFVLVQHLAPDHKSILAELVRRSTRMEVFEVEDGTPVRATGCHCWTFCYRVWGMPRANLSVQNLQGID